MLVISTLNQWIIQPPFRSTTSYGGPDLFFGWIVSLNESSPNRHLNRLNKPDSLNQQVRSSTIVRDILNNSLKKTHSPNDVKQTNRLDKPDSPNQQVRSSAMASSR
jgi:hypothetical protein